MLIVQTKTSHFDKRRMAYHFNLVFQQYSCVNDFSSKTNAMFLGALSSKMILVAFSEINQIKFRFSIKL
jgi:hypothetical protein